ncbi:hypothetical protein TNCV_5102221 [Trichonephila clavipes]|nr:hypothetical protein TNCV_5102221 [Trichonephila clavipes]
MNDVGAVKIPAYNFHDPALWFTMCDSTFQLGCPKAITDSKTKFNYIIAHLPPEAATIIRDVIMNPDPVEPYEKARTELIKRSGESSHQEISTEWRSVGDYRALNAQTIKDNYSVPNILDFTSNLHGTKIYSHIDLVKAYHQIPINPDDVHKSAIITPFGLFESTRMQFGLCNAAATFQRFIDEVFKSSICVRFFVDDILVASSSPEEHLQHLQILFTRLQQYGLSLKP